jgi:hypothetical protein
MRKSFAYVDDAGIAIAIVTPASEAVFAQEADPENPAHELPDWARPEDVINQWRWSGSGWEMVTPKPSLFHRWEDGEWRWLEQPDKALAKRAIDAAAEEARSRYITPGSGQAMEYLESYQQAKAKLADRDAETPMVAADVVAGTRSPFTAAPIQSEIEAAQVIVFMYEQWLQVGAMIRQGRLQAKAQVDSATTQAEVAQIREQAIAQLRAI